jgi:hypothetical protein
MHPWYFLRAFRQFNDWVIDYKEKPFLLAQMKVWLVISLYGVLPIAIITIATERSELGQCGQYVLVAFWWLCSLAYKAATNPKYMPAPLREIFIRFEPALDTIGNTYEATRESFVKWLNSEFIKSAPKLSSLHESWETNELAYSLIADVAEDYYLWKMRDKADAELKKLREVDSRRLTSRVGLLTATRT